MPRADLEAYFAQITTAWQRELLERIESNNVALRRYRERSEAMPICNDNSRDDRNGDYWRCTLSTGHDGPHLAGDHDHERDHTRGYIYRRWVDGGSVQVVDRPLCEMEPINDNEETDMPAMMTRAHFDRISSAVKQQRPDPKSATVGEKRVFGKIVRGLADLFVNENPRFDRERFLRACGLDGEGL